MGIYGYPNRYTGADPGAYYVLTTLDSELVNGKVLEPGVGIAITITGNEVIIENTGGGGGGGAPATSTFLTQMNETANLPNSFQVIQGANMSISYGMNTVTFAAVAGQQSFITAVAEPTLSADRQLTVTAPLSAGDGGAGGSFNVSLLPGLEYQVLATTNPTNTGFLYGADVGLATFTGGGTVNLVNISPSVNLFDCTSGSYTVNLPPASGCLNKTFIFKKFDNTSANVVDVTSVDSIDNSSTLTVLVPYQSYNLRSIGTGWIIT